MSAFGIAAVLAVVASLATSVAAGRMSSAPSLALRAAVVLGVATAVVLLACAGSTTTFRAEGYGISGEVIIDRAREVCQPGESWETCIPRCTTPAPSSSAVEIGAR
jgi:hypothetical protein